MATDATRIRLEKVNQRLRKQYRNPPMTGLSKEKRAIIRKLKNIEQVSKHRDYLEESALDWVDIGDGKMVYKINPEILDSHEWAIADKKLGRLFKALYKYEKLHNLNSSQVWKEWHNQTIMSTSF